MKNKKTFFIILTEILGCIIIFSLVVVFCLSFFGVGGGFGKDLISLGEKESQTSLSSQFSDEEIKNELNKIALTVVKNLNASFTPLSAESQEDLSFIVDTENPDALVKSYTDYIDGLSAENVKYNFFAEDFDGDGKNEYLIEIEPSLADFCKAVGDSESAEYAEKLYSENVSTTAVVLIYGAYAEGRLVFHGFSEEFSISDTTKTLKDGNLIFGFEGEESRKFVGYPDKVYENYGENAEDFNLLCNSFCSYTVNQGYDVRFYQADVANMMGSPVVISVALQDSAYSQIYNVTDGVMNLIYYGGADEQATYVVEIDSTEYIMVYTQQLNDEAEDYTALYSYRVFRIDEKGGVLVYDEMMTTVKSESYSEENGTFFEKFNGYLKDAVVCSDPYELKGYIINGSSVGIGGKEDNSNDYLIIKNCNTSKQGVVKVSEDSYLNIRSGPSVNDARVRVDSSESSFYVKPSKGATVTVIDTVNTNGSENPLWLKVKIKYLGKTITGYSSKKYIELSDIKTVSVGEKFTFEAESSSALKWNCNDEKIATINAETGELTGVSEGIVIITVTSESGLSDSCLVMIEKE